MAPLKLPPKKPKGAQSKGKGKQKQLHIDFASLDSARASAPADWNADEWLEGADSLLYGLGEIASSLDFRCRGNAAGGTGRAVPSRSESRATPSERDNLLPPRRRARQSGFSF